MAKMIDSVLDTYLEVYRGLIAVEAVDANSVTISFPFHLAGSHRVEITVTDLGNEKCIISDAARTIGELQDAGYSLTIPMKEKLERIANLSGLRIVNDYLLLESSYTNIGASIQKFLEISKMIGDVYLVHKQRGTPEKDLVAQVKTVLDSKSLLYRERDRIRGQIESHPFDLLVPPNGHPGMAVSVLGGQNTHTLAQVWGYKCDDIRHEKGNDNIKLALVYDVRFATWSDTSRKILESRADFALAGDSLRQLPMQLEKQGLVKR